MSDLEKLQRMIADLQSWGLSLQRIACLLKLQGIVVVPSTIHRIKSGQEPGYVLGLAIERLHEGLLQTKLRTPPKPAISADAIS